MPRLCVIAGDMWAGTEEARRLCLQAMTTLDLDARRRRLKFRAWHRGTREMDLLMGRFCDAEVAALTEADVSDLEHLMDAPDRDVFCWLSGEIDVPVRYDTPVFRRMRMFHTHAAPLHR